MNQRTKAKIGDRIRAARTRAGYSQERFAEAIGTTRRHLIRIERGDHVPRGDLMRRISDVTGEPVERLACDDEEDEPHVTVMFTVTGAPDDVVAALMARLPAPVGAGR